MDAYRYIRFSTPKQEGGDSIRRQTDDVGAFCERQGWTIVEDVSDLGQSAWTGAHLTEGNLGRFVDRFRSGEIKLPCVLVVEKLDRLSRQEPRKTLRWMEDLCADGLMIATVDGSRIYNDASLRADLMGTFEILMRSELAHRESQQKSERVLEAIGKNMRRAQATGQKISAKAPGWLVLNDDRMGWTVLEDRAELVRGVYVMAAEGQGARWIAKTLNERGVPAWGPARANGKPRTWEISSIKLMLAQPAVEGDYVPGFSNTSKTKRTQFKEPILGYYPRIVDADLVARARAAVAARRTGPRTGGRHTSNVANLFAGSVHCGACGNRMHMKMSGGAAPRRYLQCHHASRARGCDQKEMFAYEPLEKTALDEILHLALDNRHFAKADESGPLTIALAEVEKEIADREARARRLVRLAAAMDEDDPVVVDEIKANRQAMKDLVERKNETERRLEVARGAVSPEEHLERVRDLRDALEDEDEATRQAARLRIQTALKGLGVRLECEVKRPDDVRSTLLMLPTGFFCRIRNDGSVVGRVDMPAAASAILGSAEQGVDAKDVATLLSDAAELMVASTSGRIDENWATNEPEPGLVAGVETHLRRQAKNATENN